MGKTWIGIWAAAVTLASTAPAEAQGLLGEYYNESQGALETRRPLGSPAGPPEPITTTSTLVLTRIDAPATSFSLDWAAGSPGAGVNVDNFYIVWTGTIMTTANAGNWLFGTRSDDGTRIWVNNTLVLDNWVPQGQPGTPNMGTAINLAASTSYPIRVEFFENGGDARHELWYQDPTLMAPVIVPTTSLQPPPPPATPTLTVNQGAGGINSAVATWTSSGAGATYELQRQVNGGGFTTIQTGLTGLTFTDPNLTYGSTYCYQVRAVAGPQMSAFSAPGCVTIVAPPPRVSDHSEGFLDDKCSCGSSTIRGPIGAGLAVLAVSALLWAFRRR
jgi:hypothetical protein